MTLTNAETVGPTGTLSKSVVVMTRAATFDDRATFVVDEAWPDPRSYDMPLGTWREFGEPETITVQVKPGDRLNGKAEWHGDKDWKFEPSNPHCGLREYIGEAIGAASMCWETPEDAGIFDSSRARTIAEAVFDRANGPEGARLGMAPTEDLLNELAARLPHLSGHLTTIATGLTLEQMTYRTVDSE